MLKPSLQSALVVLVLVVVLKPTESVSLALLVLLLQATFLLEQHLLPEELAYLPSSRRRVAMVPVQLAYKSCVEK